VSVKKGTACTSTREYEVNKVPHRKRRVKKETAKMNLKEIPVRM